MRKTYNPAADLARMRKREKHICPVCLKEFDGLAGQVYDRQVCRQTAYRKRMRKREEAARLGLAARERIE